MALRLTHSQFKLGEGGHVDDTDGLFAAFHLLPDNVEPVRLVEGLALVQREQIYTQAGIIALMFHLTLELF